MKPETILKVTVLHGYLSRFLYCTSITKSRKALRTIFYSKVPVKYLKLLKSIRKLLSIIILKLFLNMKIPNG